MTNPGYNKLLSPQEMFAELNKESIWYNWKKMQSGKVGITQVTHIET